MTSPTAVSNPFMLPHSNGERHRPLRPWRQPVDDGYYVAVDSTKDEFDRFRQELGDVAGLRHSGRVALITGHKGCGKTSLAHRCAFWVREQLLNLKIANQIVDLTQTGAANMPVDARKQQICGRLIDELRFAKLISASAAKDLAPVRDQPDYAYPQLREALAELDAIAIVVLPQSDVAEEIIGYARLAPARLLFLAEGTYPGLSEDCQDGLTSDPVIYLSVGMLTHGDGWLFVDNRLGKHGRTGLPLITPETVQEVVDKFPQGAMPVRALDRILFYVFGAAMQENPPPEITYSYITDYIYKRGLRP